MSVFIDTGLFYALQNTRAENHESAAAALSVVGAGRFGQPFTSEYVFDEALTLVRSHRGYEEASIVSRRILGTGDVPDLCELLTVTPEDFENALDVFETYRDHPLSFTDATTVAVMAAEGIEYLLSFDADFDGIVGRLDPTELG